MATGTVSRLWRWPVKSMAGEQVRALSLDARGVGGDRTHAVLHEGRPLSAPELAAWSAAYPFNLDAGLDPAKPPHAIVTRPDGRRSWRWGDPQLRAALEEHLGVPVELGRDPAGLGQVPGTLLLTTGTDDAGRSRANLHLELDEEPPPGAEAAFAGGVRLELLGPAGCDGIPGIRARVIAGGRVALGEAVRVASASGGSGR